MKKILLLTLVSMALFAGCSRKTPTMVQQEDTRDELQFITGEQQAGGVPQDNQTSNSQVLQEPNGGSTMENTENTNAKLATISTSKGNVVIELYQDDAPNTVQNFLQKASSGYYENLSFHRVEDWVVQGGDPRGNGTGGGQMPTELNNKQFEVGSVGVARGGDIRVSNDSQFFICTDDCSWLTGQYTNFGKVTQGMEIVKNIAIGDKILSISYQ